jgi:serine-type D-Ala-D-Ala endopeptidase (penicillin-binding protein 7)
MFKTISAILILAASCTSSAVEIRAKSWLIADGDGTILEHENIEVVQPIASITKLMTAMVYLDSNENLKENVNTKFRGMTVNKQKLLELAIVHSDNQAADMLCKIYRRGYKACIDDMNHKAQVLGMHNTAFFDSTGLDNRNVSNAIDLIKLLQAAERYPEIVNASNKTIVELLKSKKKKTINLKYNNTNPLVAKYNVVVSKTGYVRASGGCLVMSIYIDGKKRLFVVLNSTTTRTRIRDMEVLILSELYKKA